MRQQLLKTLCFLVILVSTSLQSEDPHTTLAHTRELLDTCVISDSSHTRVRWHDAFPEQHVNYFIYESEDPLALQPLEHPGIWLSKSESQGLLSHITDELSVDLAHSKRYLRIVAQGERRAVDVATLIDLENIIPPSSETAEAILEKRPYKATVTQEEWELIAPYLLPANHPFKAILDEIFSDATPLASLEDLQKAGFEPLIVRQGRGLIVAKHPRIKKFLFKIYLDTLPKAEWPLYVNRSKGARVVKQCIEQNNYGHELKVPTKWIYALPKRPKASKAKEQTYPKGFILLVEDMHLTDAKATREHYKSTITRSQLKALFATIRQCGLSDSHVDNVPFSHDFKVAFIDTEYVNVWPVHPEWITQHLSAKNRHFWQDLIRDPSKAVSLHMRRLWEKAID
jgi:hypothetical protein